MQKGEARAGGSSAGRSRSASDSSRSRAGGSGPPRRRALPPQPQGLADGVATPAGSAEDADRDWDPIPPVDGWQWADVDISSDQGLDPEEGFTCLQDLIPREQEDLRGLPSSRQALSASLAPSPLVPRPHSHADKAACLAGLGQVSEADGPLGLRAAAGGGGERQAAARGLCVQMARQEDDEGGWGAEREVSLATEPCAGKADSIARSYLYRMSLHLESYQDFLCEFQDRCSLALQVRLHAAAWRQRSGPLTPSPSLKKALGLGLLPYSRQQSPRLSLAGHTAIEVPRASGCYQLGCTGGTPQAWQACQAACVPPHARPLPRLGRGDRGRRKTEECIALPRCIGDGASDPAVLGAARASSDCRLRVSCAAEKAALHEGQHASGTHDAAPDRP